MLFDLASDHPDLQALVRGVRGGSYCLFLGAGASCGAQNSLGTEPPLAKPLSKILLDACELDEPGMSLPRAYDAARELVGDNRVVEILSDQYASCSAGWQTLIASFNWWRIYSANIDDVLENAYKQSGNARVQDLVPVNYNETFRDISLEDDSVVGVHLHGWIHKAGAGFIFSPSEYAMATNAGYIWHTIFSDDFQKFGFIFVGTEFYESDLEAYLTARPVQYPEVRLPSFLVLPNASQGLAAAMSRKGIHCVKATGEQFFKWLDAQVPGRGRKSEQLFKRHPNLGTEDAQFAKHFLSFSRYVEQVSDQDLNEISLGPRYNAHDFYEGDEPTWYDILDGNDAVFSVVTSMLKRMDDIDNGTLPRSDLVCLTGAPGSGKSTALRRIALEASRRGRTVYYYKSVYGLPRQALFHVLRTTPPGTVFIVDNASSHANELFQLALELKKDGHPLHLITAERTTRFERLKMENKGCSVKTIPVDSLGDEDIQLLLAKLREKARLGKLQDLSPVEQVKFFKVKARRQLLVALKEATHGRSFGDIIEGEFRDVQPSEARNFYEIVSLVHQTGESLSLPQIGRASRQNTSEIVKWLAPEGPLHAIVFLRGQRLGTRHPVIAEHVVYRFLKAEDRVQMMGDLLEAIAPYLNVRQLRLNPPEAEVMRRFLDYEFVKMMARGKNGLMDTFYKRLQVPYSWNSKYWAQRGLFEGNRRNFAAAYGHTKLAVRMDGHPVNLDTHGWVLMQWAADDRVSEDEGWQHFREGMKTLDSAIVLTDWHDEYPITTALDGVSGFMMVRGLNDNPELRSIFENIYNTAIRYFPPATFAKQLERFIAATKSQAQS